MRSQRMRVARNGFFSLVALVALTALMALVVLMLGGLLFAAIWYYPEI